MKKEKVRAILIFRLENLVSNLKLRNKTQKTVIRPFSKIDLVFLFLEISIFCQSKPKYMWKTHRLGHI